MTTTRSAERVEDGREDALMFLNFSGIRTGHSDGMKDGDLSDFERGASRFRVNRRFSSSLAVSMVSAAQTPVFDDLESSNQYPAIQSK